jgi:hypothetical protein
MITVKSTASEVEKVLRDLVEKLNGLLLRAQEDTSGEEFDLYRSGIGTVMGEAFDKLLVHIYRAFPDLIPESFPVELRKILTEPPRKPTSDAEIEAAASVDAATKADLKRILEAIGYRPAVRVLSQLNTAAREGTRGQETS